MQSRPDVSKSADSAPPQQAASAVEPLSPQENSEQSSAPGITQLRESSTEKDASSSKPRAAEKVMLPPAKQRALTRGLAEASTSGRNVAARITFYMTTADAEADDLEFRCWTAEAHKLMLQLYGHCPKGPGSWPPEQETQDRYARAQGYACG